jgi:DNA helicase HerA-like ATPase
MQRDVVYQAVRDAYRARGFGGGETPPGPGEYPTLRDVLRRIERLEAQGQARNVSARCRALLEFDLFRPTPGAGELHDLLRSGAVIDLHRLADVEVLQLAAGAFVLRKLYKDMFTWGEADRLRLIVVLDEAHRLAQDKTLPKLLKEGRKFGIGVLVASQSLGDFHEDVRNNVGAKVIFRTNHPESGRVAGFISTPQGVNLTSRIEQLAVGQAYVQTPEMRLGSQVRMAPPGMPPAADDEATA